ncbi:MAG TPA: thioredoxin domain-containing protein [Longimicrobiaceae bacterium]|nr:thioredoxin domain-containing protein [Longimicrobiaceae bacterium]
MALGRIVTIRQSNIRGWPALACAAMLGFAAPGAAQMDVRDLGHFQGNPFAPVQVVEFSDFGCSACGLFTRDVKPRIFREYVETGQVGWRIIPIRLARFRHSLAAMKAAECAARQADFRPVEQALFDRQREWQGARDPGSVLRAIVAEAKLDLATWDRCYADRRWQDPTSRNNQVARRLRVPGTPTFFINGRPALGALSYEQFTAILTDEAEAAFR